MNKWLKGYVLVVAGACYIVTLLTFSLAYFNNSFRVLTTINDYGEANLEAFMLGVSLMILVKWVWEILHK